MKVQYHGRDPVLLMRDGKVWEVENGDEMDLPELPAGPWEQVKDAPQKEAAK